MGDYYEDIEKTIYSSKTPTNQRIFYYVWADNVKGRNFVDGPHNTYDEAYSWGMQHLNCSFIVEECGTKNRDEATRMIRHKVVETQGVDSALERMKHTTEDK